ncbi:hypothetical protein Tco_0921222, partial [Tanacetum coccineum]
VLSLSSNCVAVVDTLRNQHDDSPQETLTCRLKHQQQEDDDYVQVVKVYELTFLQDQAMRVTINTLQRGGIKGGIVDNSSP